MYVIFTFSTTTVVSYASDFLDASFSVAVTAVLLLAVALICGICVGGAALAAAWLGKPDAVATTAIDQDGISRSLSRGEPRAVQP